VENAAVLMDRVEHTVSGAPLVTGDQLTDLYVTNYGQLVRLASLLLGDAGAAEEVVQEAFIRVMAKRGRLRAPERTLAYLSRTVVNLAHSGLRRRLLAARHLPSPARQARGPEEEAEVAFQQAAVVQALRRLPPRQREAVVLRYYAQFTETETGAVMAISVGAVRGYTARGAARLREELKETP
jgi:RNA polymerase sigma-70 factor (sigma-E family)